MNPNNHKSPFKAPDNYFDDFKAKMMSRIESTPQYRTADETEEPIVAPQPSRWQMFRPYIYLAAMFAGMWLMINGLMYVNEWNAGRKLNDAPVATVMAPNDSAISDGNDYAWMDEILSDYDDNLYYTEDDIDRYIESYTAEPFMVNYLLAYDY